MTERSKPPIEMMEVYGRRLVDERGPVELFMACLAHPEVQWDPYQIPSAPHWGLALASAWTDDLVRKGASLRSLLPGWEDDGNELHMVDIRILPSNWPAIDDLLFFMEGQTRRHPELVDIDLPGLCFRRAYVIAHRKAGIGGKLIGAVPATAD